MVGGGGGGSAQRWSTLWHVGLRTPNAGKGAPARESRTGTRLVSPAAGCKKKKRHLWDLALEHEIQYIPIYYKYIIYVQMTHVLAQLKERPKTTEKAMREGLAVAFG